MANITKHYKIIEVDSQDKRKLKNLFKAQRDLKELKMPKGLRTVLNLSMCRIRQAIKYEQLQVEKVYVSKKYPDIRAVSFTELIQQIRRHRQQLKKEYKQMSKVERYKKHKCFESKTPKDSKQYFGLEIEGGIDFACGDSFAIELCRAIPDAYKFVSIGGDGSIRRVDGMAFELRLLLPMDNYKTKLDQIFKFLNKHKFNVNDSCGLHVHLDCRYADFRSLANRLIKMQTFFFKISDKKRKTNRYCRMTRLVDIEDCSTRYKAINVRSYREHNTIEIRLKNATVDVKEVLTYLKLLKRVYDVETTFVEKERLTDKKIEKVFDLSPDLMHDLNELKQRYAAA